LFNDKDVKMIGTQMPQYVEGSGDMSMRGKIEYTIRKEDDIGKKKTCRV
jgi:hypothetical protein